MGFMRKKTEAEEADIEPSELEVLLKKKKVPVLTLDARWHQLFPEEDKTNTIKKYETEVNELLKKQGKTTTDIDEIKKVKTKLMQSIVENMQELGGEDEKQRERKLEKSQKLIKEANRKINLLENQKGSIPKELENANQRLLTATIEDCYERIGENKEEIEEIAKWVEEIRAELKKKLIMKQEMEEQNTLIYSTLHDMLGPEIMQYFDEMYGEEK